MSHAPHKQDSLRAGWQTLQNGLLYRIAREVQNALREMADRLGPEALAQAEVEFRVGRIVQVGTQERYTGLASSESLVTKSELEEHGCQFQSCISADLWESIRQTLQLRAKEKLDRFRSTDEVLAIDGRESSPNWRLRRNARTMQVIEKCRLAEYMVTNPHRETDWKVVVSHEQPVEVAPEQTVQVLQTRKKDRFTLDVSKFWRVDLTRVQVHKPDGSKWKTEYQVEVECRDAETLMHFREEDFCAEFCTAVPFARPCFIDYEEWL